MWLAYKSLYQVKNLILMEVLFNLMRGNSVLLFFLLGFNLLGMQALAQEQIEREEEPKNVVIFTIGFTNIPKAAALANTETGSLFIPTIGFDYGRRLGGRWEVGIMLDYELAHYQIVEEELEREGAFIVVPGAAFRLVNEFYLIGGIGVELERNKNLAIARGGLEYVMRFDHKWAVAPALIVDWKENYITIGLSLGVEFNFD